ncbi:Adenylosuccinate synthetase, organellar chromatophore [subsurface metagenome]
MGYAYKGERLPGFPTESWVLEKVVPQYKKVKGWKKPIEKTQDFSSLPDAFRDYLKLIEDCVEAKIAVVSTGMERRDTILVEDELKELINLKKIKIQL